MSTLHRLKAYFGMVPAEELDEEAAWYAAEDGYGSRGEGGAYGRYEPRYREESEGPGQPAGLRQPHRAWASEPPVASSTREPTVRGALAMDTAPEPPPRAPAAPPTPAPAAHPLTRITTLQPHSYHEARTIGERYRDGTPVIINLTEMDDQGAKRLVDFSAGLAFALRGSIDKVTSRVFLLSPPNVEVSAADRRRLAEGGFYGG